MLDIHIVTKERQHLTADFIVALQMPSVCQRIAETLGLKIAPEDLEALSKQLRLLDALERDELQDYAQILKMDADWHD